MVYQLPGGIHAAAALPHDIPDPDSALRRNMRIGMIVVGALVLVLVALATLVQISGAVIGHGDVTVASKVKKIAHPTGGVIAEVYVRDGDRVRAGQPLMRLDSTVSSVSAEVTGESFDQLLADKARLTAERDGTAGIAFPRELLARHDVSARAAIAEAQRLLRLKRASVAGQRAQLSERIRQQEQLIESYRRQIAANRQQVALIGPERDSVRGLYEKQLVTTARLNQLERAAVDLEGNAASLEANIAQTRARITETRQQILLLDQDSRTAAGAELAEVTRKLSEQQVNKTNAGDTFRRSIIRAPGAGVVDKLAFTTVGGVVPQGQTILEIVPDSEDLTVEARVSPSDIDAIAVGQPAVVRFSAFSAATTPEVAGRLTRISAERAEDQRTGSVFYTIEVEVDEAETARLGGLKLVPGMPVEVFVRTADRSLLSYIVKPLRDQLSRSFRQD
ncbi:HlyD family type I secretion periplasmic adaptor subunit [Sphingomonas jatrophae]|uniref:Membrane fusion protein (MFP) family protein n=1 Tax=Sphingomonas jatrophae TaxID=1166337 RepID=A0A1I6MC05_9SPHN|nr:HlyD family type I secretion periplasmic adaptor subunit [Sphingomonas jatrophae]SFS13191.1 HlyD family secretion protein [Sphingomonas jatrophae]